MCSHEAVAQWQFLSLSASSSAFKNGTCPLDSCLTDEPGRWAALVWDNCYPDCSVQSLFVIISL